MLSPYMSPVERIWYYSLRTLCGLILLFLILPVLVIVPLSFNSGTCAGTRSSSPPPSGCAR